jgi:uncharacterized repeat protein (TIGR02543 family)
MKMKNIISITFTLVLGVIGSWAQTALPDASATLVSGTIYTATTKTINGTLTVPTGGTVTIYIPAGVTLTINGTNAGNGYNGNIGDESPRKSHSHNSTCAGNGGKENACGGAGGNGAMPAICVPTGATLILTGEGTLIATGGNAGSGGNGGNGQDAHGSFIVNYYGGAGGAGAGGGGGAAAAIGGAGGHGGAGGKGGKYGANGFLGIIGPGSGGEGGDGISGTSGQAMGNVWIIGNVTVETTNGNGSTEAAQISNGTQGTSGAKVIGWIPALSGNMQFFGGNGGNFGYGGSAATYGIGGGGNGGDGGHGGHGGDIFRENQGTENESNKSQSYTPGSAGNGTLYVQQYTSINEPDITGTTHGTVNPITTDAQMPSAIATTFTIDGESTPLRSIFYGTVIENMNLTTAEMTRTGYTFNGYKIKGTSTAVYDANGIFVYPITKVASSTDNTQYVSLQTPGNFILEADWTINDYTLTYDVNGGNALSPDHKSVTYNTTYGELPTPTRTGYTFAGWYTQATGGDAVTSSTVMGADDVTIHAHWTINNYTLTYNVNGGNALSPDHKSVTYNTAYGELPTPTRTGYTFAGWYTLIVGGTTVSNSTVMGADDVTIYAHWTANTYSVVFDRQSGSGGTESVTATFGSAMPSASAPTRAGYTFAGYYTSPNGGGTQYYDENMVSVSYWNITTNPSTLYANWTANTYTLNFDVQNGDALSPSTQSVTYDAAYGTLPTPTRYGFAFKGWYTTPNGGSETDTEVLTSDIYSIDGDQTIYAHWNTIVVDIDAYSAEEQLTGNYFRTFYDSQIAHILPDGVKAYKGKIEGNYLVLTAIEAKDDDDNDIIPRNVPVILRMMPNEEAGVPIPGDLYQIKTKQISLTTSESELTIDNTDNELIGSDIVIATAVANSYILSFGSNGLGFYEWSTHPLEAHKAYVIKDSVNPAKALTFRFEDDVTGINETIKDFMFNDSNMVIYNLNGIRLSKPQKGLNIINGRKVWVK